jgi:hypothetical protein
VFQTLKLLRPKPQHCRGETIVRQQHEEVRLGCSLLSRLHTIPVGGGGCLTPLDLPHRLSHCPIRTRPSGAEDQKGVMDHGKRVGSRGVDWERARVSSLLSALLCQPLWPDPIHSSLLHAHTPFSVVVVVVVDVAL